MSQQVNKAKQEMERALASLETEFLNLRTGRPSIAQLNNITIDYYGVQTPITQVAAVKIPEAHLMTVEPWDKSICPKIQKAILASHLGITPNDDGSGLLRLPFPAPSEERRREIVKECRAAAERARVGVRVARKNARNHLERAKKAGELAEDELHRQENKLQKLTDEYVKKVDDMLAEKEKDVMEI